jgi:hypothetical protein
MLHMLTHISQAIQHWRQHHGAVQPVRGCLKLALVHRLMANLCRHAAGMDTIIDVPWSMTSVSRINVRRYSVRSRAHHILLLLLCCATSALNELHVVMANSSCYGFHKH